MSRYRGPRIKIIRRLGILPGLTRKIPKKSLKLRSLSLQSKSKKKIPNIAFVYKKNKNYVIIMDYMNVNY